MNKPPCAVKGCPKPRYYARPYCRGHQRRVERHGNPQPDKPLQSRIKVRPPDGWTVAALEANARHEGECRVWMHRRNDRGYGLLGSNQRVHRKRWELEHGPIPPGLCVLHRCDNPPCFRIDHLFLGTRADNSADMVTKGRSPRGERNGHAILSQADVIRIHQLRAEGLIAREIAQRFNVGRWAVHAILQGKNWPHLHPSANN